MSRGTNNTPWRNLGSLSLPGSHTLPPKVAPRPAVCQQPADLGLDSAALDMDAVTVELEKQRRLLNQQSQCEGDGCTTLLSRYTAGKLCSVCRRKTKKQPETCKAFNARQVVVRTERRKQAAAVSA